MQLRSVQIPYMLAMLLCSSVQALNLTLTLENDPDAAGLALIKASTDEASTADMDVCTWAEHQHAPQGAAALNEVKVVSKKKCRPFPPFLSVPARSPGDYVFHAVAVRQGTVSIEDETVMLSPVASLRFSVNHKADDCVALSSDLPRMAVVTASFGGYDPLRGVHARDCSGLVDYYTFTDTPGYVHNRVVITHPYHLHDDVAKLRPGGKNSLADMTRLSPSRVSMMASKYIKVSTL
jgi:hypothetical protein